MFTKKVLVFALFTTATFTGFSRAEVVYQFSKVADGLLTNFGTLGLYPGLNNNNNQVSYGVRSSSSNGDIMRWDNGVSTRLGNGTFITQVPINDDGAVAYYSGTRAYIANDSGVVELFSSPNGIDKRAERLN
jgi:hypothetical protein